jgi:hypothetical protein
MANKTSKLPRMAGAETKSASDSREQGLTQPKERPLPPRPTKPNERANV